MSSTEPPLVVQRPRYLRPHDDGWLRTVCEAHVDLSGLSQAEVELAWAERIMPEIRARGVGKGPLMLARRVLTGLSTSRVEAPLDPRRVRGIIFPLAAVHARDEALALAATELGVSPAAVVSALFADRVAERRLVGPASMPELAALRERCNLLLVQSWLSKCTELRVVVREHLRAVVRFAKLLGLLVDFRETEGVTEICASGPLALFRRTVKYGRALAQFFPCVVASPGYAALADCVVDGEVRRVRIDSGDPLAAPHRLPRSTDSKIERALVKDLSRLRTSWSLVREDRVVRHVDGHLFFPDFTLVDGERRVFVEVVGFHTADYLRRKSRMLAALRERCIVCVDSSLNCGETPFTGDDVIYFAKRVDAAALLALAERSI
ncbi:hypothetical protein BH09MYX1_BH09MYX1_36770 [soil metagenome]